MNAIGRVAVGERGLVLVSHSWGLMSLSLQFSMRVAMTAQLPPSSEPAKSAFFRLCIHFHNRNYAKRRIMCRYRLPAMLTARFSVACDAA